MHSLRGEEGLLAGVDDRQPPPPAVVKVDLQGDTARIGDPRHGWLAVDRGRFLAALDIPAGELAAQLRASNTTERTLDGHEPHITLAALAVHHLDTTPLARHADTAITRVQRETPAIELTL
jgi:hypothetical protein